MYFSYFYCQEGNDENKDKRQELVVRKVQDEYKSRRSFDTSNTKEQTTDWTNPLDSVRVKGEEGAFRVPTGGDTGKKGVLLFKASKIVLWKQIGSTAYILICEEEENRLLAAQFLTLFTKVLDEHFKKPGIAAHPKEFLNRAEEFLILLQTFLTNGLLLFINSQVSKQLRKDAESLLLSK